jgi:hypothetical protein
LFVVIETCCFAGVPRLPHRARKHNAAGIAFSNQEPNQSTANNGDKAALVRKCRKLFPLRQLSIAMMCSLASKGYTERNTHSDVHTVNWAMGAS